MKPQNCKNVTLTAKEVDQIRSWVPEHHRFGTWEHCFYCGESATSIDHVIPHSMLTVEKRTNGASGSPGLKTMACAECNSVLSNLFFPTLSERCYYLNGRIRRRYSNLLHLETWQDWEMKEIKGGLRDYVRMKQAERTFAVNRASWQSGHAFTELFDKAFNEVVEEYPANTQLHNFMRPHWMWSEPAKT